MRVYRLLRECEMVSRVSRYHGIIGITTDFGEIFSLFLFYIYYHYCPVKVD